METGVTLFLEDNFRRGVCFTMYNNVLQEFHDVLSSAMFGISNRKAAQHRSTQGEPHPIRITKRRNERPNQHKHLCQ